MTIQETAQQAREHFVLKTRTDETEYWSAPDAPQWISDLCHDAHGQMMPDNYKYKMIVGVLDAIPEYDDLEGGDADHEIADGLVSVYHNARVAWLGSHHSRLDYADEAREEQGVESGSIIEAIGWGWYQEAVEVFRSVLASLEAKMKTEG